MNKPHKHAELIKAWADGAEIEMLLSSGWEKVSNTPSWFNDRKYRIKPEPDYVEYLARFGGAWRIYYSSQTANFEQIKLTRDGETHKIKSVELVS